MSQRPGPARPADGSGGASSAGRAAPARPAHRPARHVLRQVRLLGPLGLVHGARVSPGGADPAPGPAPRRVPGPRFVHLPRGLRTVRVRELAGVSLHHQLAAQPPLQDRGPGVRPSAGPAGVLQDPLPGHHHAHRAGAQVRGGRVRAGVGAGPVAPFSEPGYFPEGIPNRRQCQDLGHC